MVQVGNFSNYNKGCPDPAHIPPRHPRPARDYVTGPRGNQYGCYVCFPVLDLCNQPYSIQTSVFPVHPDRSQRDDRGRDFVAA